MDTDDDRPDWQGVAHLKEAEAGRGRGKERGRERAREITTESYYHTFPS